MVSFYVLQGSTIVGVVSISSSLDSNLNPTHLRHMLLKHIIKDRIYGKCLMKISLIRKSSVFELIMILSFCTETKPPKFIINRDVMFYESSMLHLTMESRNTKKEHDINK
ncbi:hypothetical protein CR513_02063, partial [Mucuna pruriens]